MRDLPIPDVPTSLPDGVAPQTTAIAAFAASMAGYIPAILALIPAIYYLILIWESSTVQHYIRNVRMRRQARKLLKLKAAAKVAQAKLDAEELVRRARAAAKETIKIAAAEASVQAVADKAKIEEKIPPV